MTATYGWRITGAGRAPLLPPYAFCTQPLPPEKVYHDRSEFCHGCPYPRHGMMCSGADGEKCLRENMQELEIKWKKARIKS